MKQFARSHIGESAGIYSSLTTINKFNLHLRSAWDEQLLSRRIDNDKPIIIDRVSAALYCILSRSHTVAGFQMSSNSISCDEFEFWDQIPPSISGFASVAVAQPLKGFGLALAIIVDRRFSSIWVCSSFRFQYVYFYTFLSVLRFCRMIAPIVFRVVPSSWCWPSCTAWAKSEKSTSLLT